MLKAVISHNEQAAIVELPMLHLDCIFKIVYGDDSPIGLDAARLHHDHVDAEGLQFHPQAVGQPPDGVFRGVMSSALRSSMRSTRRAAAYT